MDRLASAGNIVDASLGQGLSSGIKYLGALCMNSRIHVLNKMAPPVASAKLTLSYPLYAADFDPRCNEFLVVGGGGGEGRSGVGNKIVSSMWMFLTAN